MTKDIKDYLHLYLGCEMQCVSGSSDYEYVGLKVRNSPLLLDKHSNGNWKLILRPLSDMTEEEAQEYLNKQYPEKRLFDVAIEKDRICYRQYKVQNHFMDFDRITRNLNSESVTYLLSKGFDLFGLIEAGLAIDKTKELQKTLTDGQ